MALVSHSLLRSNTVVYEGIKRQKKKAGETQTQSQTQDKGET